MTYRINAIEDITSNSKSNLAVLLHTPLEAAALSTILFFGLWSNGMTWFYYLPQG